MFRVLRGPVMNRIRYARARACVCVREREREGGVASLDVSFLVGCGAPSPSDCWPTF